MSATAAAAWAQVTALASGRRYLAAHSTLRLCRCIHPASRQAAVHLHGKLARLDQAGTGGKQFPASALPCWRHALLQAAPPRRSICGTACHALPIHAGGTRLASSSAAVELPSSKCPGLLQPTGQPCLVAPCRWHRPAGAAGSGGARRRDGAGRRAGALRGKDHGRWLRRCDPGRLALQGGVPRCLHGRARMGAAAMCPGCSGSA